MPIAKTLVAALMAVLAAILPGLTDGPMGLPEWLNVVVLAAGALQVYNAGNVPGWRFAKLIAAAISAGVVILISAISDGVVSPAETIQITLAVAQAVGVWGVPNRGVRARAA